MPRERRIGYSKRLVCYSGWILASLKRMFRLVCDDDLLDKKAFVVNILALETSGRQGSLAVARADGSEVEIISTRTLPATVRTAQTLIPEIRALLKQCDLAPTDVQLIGVTIGPGSFTGLRIGATVAKTFSYSTGAKLVSVHTLAALAEPIVQSGTRVWTIMDAQRKELFAACHTTGGESLAILPDTKVIGIPSWLENLEPGDTVCGPPLEKLSKRIGKGITVVESALWSPQADAVTRLGFKLYQQGRLTDPIQLVPNYYRKSAAEEKADA